MGLVHRSKTSIKDYREIWDYIAAQDRTKAADQLLADFESTLAMLSGHPLAGVARPELGQKLRSFPVGKYILFYRPIRNGIMLTRVLHSARNLPKIFKR